MKFQPLLTNQGKEICEDLVEVWGLKIEDGSDAVFLRRPIDWTIEYHRSRGLLDISTTSRVPSLTPQPWEGQESLLRRTQLGWCSTCSSTINHESCLSNCHKFETFLFVDGNIFVKDWQHLWDDPELPVNRCPLQWSAARITWRSLQIWMIALPQACGRPGKAVNHFFFVSFVIYIFLLFSSFVSSFFVSSATDIGKARFTYRS